jgi:hypothetical protein
MLVKSRPAVSSILLGAAHRSYDNLGDTVRIVARRFAARPARYPDTRWSVWAVVWVLLVAAAFLRLDTPAGQLHDRWPRALIDLTEILTQFGLGGWYLAPAALLLAAANLIDWRRLSRQSLMLAYNWTCLAALVLSAIGLSGIAVNVLKYGIGRARPLYFDKSGVLSLHPFAFDARYAGFPSGHATTMGALFGILLLLFPQRWYVALLLTACIASTRVFDGAPYPTDTVAV